MPFIVTPSQLSERAELYHQLGSLISAGVPILKGLEQVRNHPPSRSYRDPLTRVIENIQNGYTFTQSMTSAGQWLPSFDLALLEAGEKSGRLDACLKLLANYYRDRAQMLRRVIGNLLYPALLFHMAIIIFPITSLVGLVKDGNIFPFLQEKALTLLPIYGVIFFGIWACQGKRGQGWRAFIEMISGWIPILGGAVRDLSLARLAAALEALISAGIPILNAWEIAAVSSGSPRLRRVIFSWKPRFELGQTPAEMLQGSSEFPETFTSLYHAGEISGQQDDCLRRIYIYYQEEGSRKLELFSQWFPKLVYFGVVGYVVYWVFSFWTGYFQQLSDVMK
jgi:type IV pilus assembly protein PilC